MTVSRRTTTRATVGHDTWGTCPSESWRDVRRTVTLFVVTGLTAFAALPRESRAQIEVKSSDVKCRNHIGTSTQRLVGKSLVYIDSCYAGKSTQIPCDQVQGLRPGPFPGAPTGFSRAQAYTAGITNAWCVEQQNILANYPAAQRASGRINLVGPQVQVLLNASASSLQGAGPASGRAKHRCIRMIGKQRTKVVNQVLAQAVHCQRALDKHATSFGIISPTCLGPAPRASQRSKPIARACAGFAGPDIGTCGPLPDCVIASATQTGHDLAVATYGARPEEQGQLCGNGVVNPGESCDEGPMNSPTGACTDTCQKAACGDGTVETGVEECDPGSQPGTTTPVTDDPDCNSDCQFTRCGDGVVQTGGHRRPDEQCDDGDKNGTPGDQCTPTCQFVTVSCPAGGTIDVTATFISDSSTFSSGNIAGIDLSIGYPPSVSFPGSQFLPLEDPSDPASRIVLLGGPFDLYNVGALISLFDYDTSIRTLISGGTLPSNGNNGFMILNFPEIPFERIRFDCPADTEVTAAAFPCTINQMVNQIGGTVPMDELPECKIPLPPS